MPKRNTRNNSDSLEENNMTMDEKLNTLLDEVRKIRLGNSECLSEITKIKEDIKSFKEDIGKSVDMCFDKIKDCEDSIGKQSTSINVCESQIDNLRSENTALKSSVCDLKKRLAAAEQYSRSNCLEINGVPETKNENILAVVKRVASALNFNLIDDMIDAAHRLSKNPNKPDAPRGIIVKFCRRLDMEEMRQRARVKKSISALDLGYQSENRIFVNLSLGKDTRLIWTQVRKFKQEYSFKYAWITSAGKIFLRKKENEAAVPIADVSDLERLK